jgi:uncharacterized protein (TIGR03083 family)
VAEVDVDYGGAYSALRARVIELVAQASDEQLEAYAPATPDWRVRDLLAHLTGVTADILTGNIEGVATDDWTRTQVDARREWAVDALIAEWAENGPMIDPMIPAFGAVAGQFLTDAITHEQDIRGALDAPGARECEAVAISFTWIGTLVGGMREQVGAGALRVETESGAYAFGNGEPRTTCATTQFEFIRATTGRRSVEQIESWSWDGDPCVDTLVLPIFTPRAEPLVE